MYPRATVAQMRSTAGAPPPPPPPSPMGITISGNAVGSRADGPPGASSVTTNTVTAIIDNMGVPRSWTYQWFVGAGSGGTITINGQGTPSASFTKIVADGENTNRSISCIATATNGDGVGSASAGLAFVSHL